MSYEAKPTLDMLDQLRNLEHLRNQVEQVPRKETADPPKHALPIGTGEELALIVDDIFRQSEDAATAVFPGPVRRGLRAKDTGKDPKPQGDDEPKTASTDNTGAE